MPHRVLRRINLILEESKLNQLRRKIKARSNSEAVRIVIDRELATTTGLEALHKLRANGTLEDVFRRARAGRK